MAGAGVAAAPPGHHPGVRVMVVVLAVSLAVLGIIATAGLGWAVGSAVIGGALSAAFFAAFEDVTLQRRRRAKPPGRART